MRTLATLVTLGSTVGISSVIGGPVQDPFLTLPLSAASHQQAVKNIFLQSYSAYKRVYILS
jgi:mannosyl-oligosaccharide alpha-1,2-mannosidase